MWKTVPITSYSKPMVGNVSKLAVWDLDWVKMCKILQHNKLQAFLLLKRPTTKAAYKDKENI